MKDVDGQKIVRLCAEKREDWPKVADFLSRGALMFVYGRRMGIVCIATGQKEAAESLIRGRILGLAPEAVPTEADIKQHKGLAKILSLMLPLELAKKWIANADFFDDWTDADIAGKMMWRCQLRVVERVIPEHIIKGRKIPKKYCYYPASEIPQVIIAGRRGTNEIQFSAMSGTMGELTNWLIKEHEVFITGTSANYAGQPTIIDRAEFELFVDAFATDQPKVILEGSLTPNNGAGIDSLSIFWPQQNHQRRTAFVIREAVDCSRTVHMLNNKGVRVVFDRPESKFAYTLTERAKMASNK